MTDDIVGDVPVDAATWFLTGLACGTLFGGLIGILACVLAA